MTVQPALFGSPSQPWCQRWTDRHGSWHHPGRGPRFDPARYDVVRLPEHAERHNTAHTGEPPRVWLPAAPHVRPGRRVAA